MRYAPLIEQTFEVVGTSGDEYVCRCPWHNDKGKPNLYVNATKGVYLCMSCGAKGHLRSLRDDLPPPSTQYLRERLKGMTHIPPRVRTYPEGWLKQYDFPHDYWASRGLTKSIVKEFSLGYDPFNDQVTIPMRDEQGRVLGVIRRRLDGGVPKYLYPKGFKIGRYLFGAWKVEQRRKIALVEGSIDAIACWDARVPALAMLGSRLTADQVAVLSRLGISHVVLLPDNDAAGQKAIQQVIEAIQGAGIALSVGWYRDYWIGCKDPASLKPDRRRKMYHSAPPFHRYVRRA